MDAENETPEEGQNSEDELFDAVSSAIDEVTQPEQGDESQDDETPGDESQDDESQDDETPGDESQDDESQDDESQDDESQDDESQDDESQDDAPSGEDADGDPLNDPIPEGTAEQTQKRIRSLIDTVKARTVEADQGKEIVGAVAEAGVSPEQFATTLGVLRLYNSTDREERSKALEIMRGMVQELSLDLGEGANVVDLNAHADLVAEVEQGALTEERAREIAAGRELKKLNDQRKKEADDRKQNEQQTQQLVETGRANLNAFEATARAADPEGYERIRPKFIELLRPQLRRSHPTEWGKIAKEMYQNLKDFMPATPPVTTGSPKPSSPQPLRAKTTGGGGSSKQTQPKSAVDAMSRALEGL